jgi:hypothetical protein
MNEEQQLALIKPEQLYKVATDVAGLCGEIVKKTAISIKGRKYVKVEGWEAIAAAHGYVAGARGVERVDTGFRCIGELRRINDGVLIAQSEGFVGDDEATWEKRNEYAIRAMAQTRAISRVCRSAFAHVVVLIDSELSTTPAEEMPREEPPHDRVGNKTPLKKPADDTGRKAAIASLRHFLESNKIPETFLMGVCYEANLADGSEEKLEDLKDGVLQRFGTDKWRTALQTRWEAKCEALAKASSSAAVAAAETPADENVGRSEWKRPMTTLTGQIPLKCLETCSYTKWQDVPIIRGANKDVLLGDLTPAQLRHYITRWTPTKDEDGGYEDIEIVMDAALTLAAQEQ